ncbi:hypothetical protein AK812_SmicGene31107 [Symbiodinium microadriaticum]|uniref:Uncharacterized protein n=1 Tax=Symbiodinium microadriaticum TaxID=2951 RepID=A0A1Q9CXK2_SYMMI|nr:hypothetical protein AK812_SmicGene31107 [Symbiodinium microadriaticum]
MTFCILWQRLRHDVELIFRVQRFLFETNLLQSRGGQSTHRYHEDDCHYLGVDMFMCKASACCLQKVLAVLPRDCRLSAVAPPEQLPTQKTTAIAMPAGPAKVDVGLKPPALPANEQGIGVAGDHRCRIARMHQCTGVASIHIITLTTVSGGSIQRVRLDDLPRAVTGRLRLLVGGLLLDVPIDPRTGVGEVETVCCRPSLRWKSAPQASDPDGRHDTVAQPEASPYWREIAGGGINLIIIIIIISIIIIIIIIISGSIIIVSSMSMSMSKSKSMSKSMSMSMSMSMSIIIIIIIIIITILILIIIIIIIIIIISLVVAFIVISIMVFVAISISATRAPTQRKLQQVEETGEAGEAEEEEEEEEDEEEEKGEHIAARPVNRKGRDAKASLPRLPAAVPEAEEIGGQGFW